MKTSRAGIDLIKEFEGVRYRPYQCPAKLWTVGVGHVIDPSHTSLAVDVRADLPIPEGWDRTLSDAEVDELLAKDLATTERGVKNYCPAALNYQPMYDALVSFCFNVGLGNFQRSTLRKLINRGDYIPAADEFRKWTKAGGQTLNGLVRRREAERALYLSSF